MGTSSPCSFAPTAGSWPRCSMSAGTAGSPFGICNGMSSASLSMPGGATSTAPFPPVLSPDFGLIAHLGQQRGERGGLHVILSRRSRGKVVDRYLGWWWHENICAMCFSLDGRRLAVTGWDSHECDPGEGVALWDVAAVQRARASGADEPRWIERRAAATLLPADDFLMSLAFSPDGATLA